ncbi:DEAD/DEAH box helicase family protein [Herpetosiphon geysericola]|uniref:Restriction endonuclease subunit R n=1 Tax=Herpetosiphon geysericola TaxID=70996 RepID=A0A0P6Y036_9CHLR|nr:DEAD/DEAH box helicase family protein [Herpetosiphon geysericola]KPL90669.1 restriction endonuclease subunit R [Herpetosiphon geysericola]
MNLDERNLSALQPLFKPWIEPTMHRQPNPLAGSAAIIAPGRRPSKAPLVNQIRQQVNQWRLSGYAGVSETSRSLLNYWFNSEHLQSHADGSQSIFRYHWAQREAVESIIYLYELRHTRNDAELLFEYGDDASQNLALGITPEQLRWAKYCLKVATGVGKTKVMSLLIVWSYFHSLFEPNSELASHIVLLAPNLTVYERLKDDFANNAIFYNDPLIPEEWRNDFQMSVVLQDSSGGASTHGAVYLTNIHRLYERQAPSNATPSTSSLFGPSVQAARALDTGAALRQRISSHPRILVLNDEAHHLHDEENAWNNALESLHTTSLGRGNAGISMQIDLTATPKHNDGSLFRHIICDTPLGEAVDGGIIKVPVLGESNDLVEQGDKNTPAQQRFAIHLQLGYERYRRSYDEWQATRKPILFVMTEDAKSANEISDYLNSDQFPLLKGRVLNIHTKLTGSIKTVKRNGKEYKEFVENENKMSADDLQALRTLSRELDQADSPYRCVVSVMMLREGWDVRNVTTIVPLRPYTSKANILPEQTLGRGLRRMVPQGDLPETVTVVHHPAFSRLYADELAQEGLDVAIMPLSAAVNQSVTIFVDHERKPVSNLEISIPQVSDAVETLSELPPIPFEEIQSYFRQRFAPLPIGKPRHGQIDYKERHLFTAEQIASYKIDMGLLETAYTASNYFAQMIGRACHLASYQSLVPLIEDFISSVLFERPVNRFNGEIDHRMRDLDVHEHIRATFVPLILQKLVHKVERRNQNSSLLLSGWKPFQASNTDKRPVVTANRTMFNLVPCDNEFEQEFVDFCNYADDIAAFAKNTGPQRLMIDYIRPDGQRAHYIPDFFIRQKNGNYSLVELKGREDLLVPIKGKAAIEWCAVASQSGSKWRYIYVPYHLFQQQAPDTLEQLARASEPSLSTLLGDAQLVLPVTPLEPQPDSFERLLKEAGISKTPPTGLVNVMRQAIGLLEYAEQQHMRDLAHAFQPLLGPLDIYALRILEEGINPYLPSNALDYDSYFFPALNNVYNPGKRSAFERNGRYLKMNLVEKKSIQKLGNLLFCLDYTFNGRERLGGVWKDVHDEFDNKTMRQLYTDLNRVNQIRNTRIAHIEQRIDDPAEAWREMLVWLRCVATMAQIVIDKKL